MLVSIKKLFNISNKIKFISEYGYSLDWNRDSAEKGFVGWLDEECSVDTDGGPATVGTVGCALFAVVDGVKSGGAKELCGLVMVVGTVTADAIDPGVTVLLL